MAEDAAHDAPAVRAFEEAEVATIGIHSPCTLVRFPRRGEAVRRTAIAPKAACLCGPLARR
jgi:hypothetical protein